MIEEAGADPGLESLSGGSGIFSSSAPGEGWGKGASCQDNKCVCISMATLDHLIISLTVKGLLEAKGII